MKIMTILIIILLTAQVGYAKEIVLKEKDPATATVLAIFPGCIIGGMGNFYAGNITTGITQLLVQAGSIWLISNPASGTMGMWDNVITIMVVGTGIIGCITSIAMDITTSKEYIEIRNRAIRTNDYGILKDYHNYKAKAWVYGGMGIFFGAFFSSQGFAGDASVMVTWALTTFGISLPLALGHYLEAESFPGSNAISLVPVITPAYQGVMALKRF